MQEYQRQRSTAGDSCDERGRKNETTGKVMRTGQLEGGKGETGGMGLEKYVFTPLGASVLPVMRRSQASLHSLMTSRAYFLFLHSPLKAKEFSGFPSGI